MHNNRVNASRSTGFEARQATAHATRGQAANEPRAFETPFLLAALRCVVSYILLPVVLPLFGVFSGAGLGIVLALDLIAACSIVVTLRRLWQLEHPHRWLYLTVALAIAMLVGLFVLTDAGAVV